MKEKIKRHRRQISWGICLGILFSGMNAVGDYVNQNGAGGLSALVRNFCLWGILGSFIVTMLLLKIGVWGAWISNLSWNKKVELLLQKKSSFWMGWGIIFFMWLPVFLASWPGVYVIDNVFQMQWFEQGNISAHHPILHTYLLGAFMEAGRKWLGSYEMGLGLYSLTQMLVMAGIFSYLVYGLRGKLPGIVRIFCLILYGILPYHAVSSFTATKDILYAGFFLLLVLKTCELIWDKDLFFTSKGKMAEYVVLVFLTCCFRNTGIYIFICMIPVWLLLCRPYWKKVLLLSVVPLLLWGIYTGPVYGILKVEKGSRAEMLSVPMQQMSRAVLEEGDKIPQKDREEIVSYIPGYEQYAARVADPVKDTFHGKLFDENPKEFLSLWIRTGFRCPGSYIKAFLELNMGFWWPQMQFPDEETYLAYVPYQNADPVSVGNIPGKTVYIERKSLLPEVEHFYNKLTEQGGFEQLGVISWLCRPGVYFWFLCFCIAYVVCTKRYEGLLPLSLLAALCLSLMLSPVVVFRYVYPMIVCFPVFLWIILGKYKKNEGEKNGETL